MTPTVTRRTFLQLCAAAGVVPRFAYAADPPKKGGTLRVGFYIEAVTMDPHRSRRHDGLAQGYPGARRWARARREGRGHGAVRVRRVGEGLAPRHQAQRELLEQAGRSLSGSRALSSHPRRRGEAAEPAGR